MFTKLSKSIFRIKTFGLVAVFAAGLSACSSKPCDQHAITSQTTGPTANHVASQQPAANTTKQQEGSQNMNAQMKNQDLSQRVRIYKPDGSLQCGMGKKIDLATMQKDLGDIKVYNSENKHDGLMRVQVCGHPTGNCNVFEIDESNLEKATKLGFKKWIRD